MSNESHFYVARLPRHEVTSAERARLRVRRIPDSAGEPVTAVLVDFSRQGLRLRSVERFAIGERLAIQVSAGEDFTWPNEVTIRWRREEQAPESIYGGVFDEPVEWEVLGELLLRGVLSMD